MVEHDFVNFPELTNTQIDEFGLTSPHKQITEDFQAQVIKVTDGDTITLGVSFRDFTFPLRFLDIDAPEMHTGAPGTRAKDWLTNRIINTEVTIQIDPNNRVDKFGRLLGRVFRNGMDVGNEELILGLVTRFDQRREGEIPDFRKELSIKKWL